MTARYRIGEWEVDASTRILRRNNDSKTLTPRAVDVLVHLAAHPGEVVSGSTLIEAFWPSPMASPNAIQKIVSELRHALGGDHEGNIYIETVPKRGYRLVAEVSSTGSESLRWPHATLVTLGKRTALLIPPQLIKPEAARDFLEQIYREMVVCIGQVGSASVAKVPIAVDAKDAFEGDADFRVALRARELDGCIHATVDIQPRAMELPGYIEHFESKPSEGSDLLKSAASHVVDDLLVLLDDEHLRLMHEWGTRNVRAYRFACEGNTYQRIYSPESLARADEHFRRSLEEDPRFSYAYRALSAIYEQLGQDAHDSPTREEQRAKLQSLLRDATNAGIDEEYLRAIDRTLRYASTSNAIDAGKFWSEELFNDVTDPEALAEFGKLLMGSKLLDESQQYLDRALSRPMPIKMKEDIRSWFSGLAAARGDFEENIRLNKRDMETLPDLTFSLYGTARSLAKLGRFQEAEMYVERLLRTDPAWGWSARASLRAVRGDTPLGSAELQSTLENATNGIRGEICFYLGDIEGGISACRRLESFHLRTMWAFASVSEAYYSPSIVRDERYQAMVEELGIGKTWRTHMRAHARALAQITGIEVTTPPPPEDLLPS